MHVYVRMNWCTRSGMHRFGWVYRGYAQLHITVCGLHKCVHVWYTEVCVLLLVTQTCLCAEVYKGIFRCVYIQGMQAYTYMYCMDVYRCCQYPLPGIQQNTQGDFKIM